MFFWLGPGDFSLKNDAFIVIDNNAKPVVGNPATNAITSLGSGANIITESDLGAQGFNSSTNHLGDYLPEGYTNAGTNTTSNVPVSPANFFRSCTLSDITNPLSAELAYLQRSCNGSTVVLNWTALSENNTGSL